MKHGMCILYKNKEVWMKSKKCVIGQAVCEVPFGETDICSLKTKLNSIKTLLGWFCPKQANKSNCN